MDDFYLTSDLMTENDFIVSLQGLFESAYSQGFSLYWIYDRTELAAEEFLELHGYYEDLNDV